MEWNTIQSRAERVFHLFPIILVQIHMRREEMITAHTYHLQIQSNPMQMKELNQWDLPPSNAMQCIAQSNEGKWNEMNEIDLSTQRSIKTSQLEKLSSIKDIYSQSSNLFFKYIKASSNKWRSSISAPEQRIFTKSFSFTKHIFHQRSDWGQRNYQ